MLFPLSPRRVPEVKTANRTIKTQIPVPESVPLLQELAEMEPVSMQGQPPIIWERASGFTVEDAYGNRWIDFSSGVLVTNSGHAHPHIQAALKAQADKLLYAYCFATNPRLSLMRKLKSVVPAGYKVFLLSTGSEALENLIKIMRAGGHRAGGPQKNVIVSFANGFHGRTLGAQQLGGFEAQKDWIRHRDPDFVQVPFPDDYLCKDLGFDGFRKALDSAGIGPERVCGVIMESYQGGTARFAPVDYVRELRSWCDQHNVLLGFDEVQAGMGRTGRLFAYEHYGVTADCLALGKGLGGSMPMAATVARAELHDRFAPGSMTSTWSAHTLGCAAALANLEVFENENLVQKTAELGRHLHDRISSWPQKYGHVAGVGGKGLVAGIYIADTDNTPDQATAFRITQHCYESGLMLFAPIGPGGATVKLAPPLNIDAAALAEGLDVLEDAVRTSFKD